jgi:AraC family transcriptional regulator
MLSSFSARESRIVDHSTGGVSMAEPVFDVPSEQIIQSSRGKNWNGVDAAEIVHPLDDFALPAIPRHILVVNLGAPSIIYERRNGSKGHLGTGNLVILPAGAPSIWHVEHRGEMRHLHLYLDTDFIQRVALEADINPDTAQLIEAMGIADPQIEAIALSFLTELRSDGPGGRIYADSLATLLTLHLLRDYSSVKRPHPSRPAPGLSKTTLKRVTTYIEDHLAEDLSLADIAAVAALSPYHFARLFKESTGLTPHQYIIRRRIARAKLLLSTTDWSLTIIAHAVGFASESHLALHFKRITGLTPRHYR